MDDSMIPFCIFDVKRMTYDSNMKHWWCSCGFILTDEQLISMYELRVVNRKAFHIGD